MQICARLLYSFPRFSPTNGVFLVIVRNVNKLGGNFIILGVSPLPLTPVFLARRSLFLIPAFPFFQPVYMCAYGRTSSAHQSSSVYRCARRRWSARKNSLRAYTHTHTQTSYADT